jgi:hypothetical protein
MLHNELKGATNQKLTLIVNDKKEKRKKKNPLSLTKLGQIL